MIWLFFPSLFCHITVTSPNASIVMPVVPTSGNQQWSLFVCVERCWKGKRHSWEGEGDEIWLAGSTRMSHSPSSLDLEWRAYSGLRWRQCVWLWSCPHTASKPALAWLNPTAEVTRFSLVVSTLRRWRKMKVVWQPNYNTEARFNGRYLSSLSAPKSLYNTIRFIMASISFWQLPVRIVYLWFAQGLSVRMFFSQDTSSDCCSVFM